MSDSLQGEIDRQLQEMVAEGETGLQIAAYHHGTLVVHAWAGDTGIDGNSLLPVFSTGKGITTTAVHLLVERGVLDWDAPIARWWPAFAANGKAAITVRQVLTHSAGLARLPEQGQTEDLLDWDTVCRYLESEAPFPAPGSERHYHAITFGWLLGETIRRSDGRPFQRFVAEEIAGPLGIDGLLFGVPDDRLPQVLDVHPAPASQPDPPAAAPNPDDRRTIIAARAIPAWTRPLEDLVNRRDVRQACLPASNGVMNAHSIATHYAALIGNGVDGVRLLSDRILNAATTYQPLPNDPEQRFGLGYILSGPDEEPGRIFGHGGYGGSFGIADRRHHLAIGFTCRRTGGLGGHRLVDTIRRHLGC